MVNKRRTRLVFVVEILILKNIFGFYSFFLRRCFIVCYKSEGEPLGGGVRRIRRELSLGGGGCRRFGASERKRTHTPD